MRIILTVLGLRIQTALFVVLSLCSALAFASIANASQYEFTTLAGRAGGQGSEDGLRDSARFKEPQGIAHDTLGNFVTMTGTRTVTSIDAQWERVTVQEPAPPATAPSAFARVQVTLP